MPNYAGMNQLKTENAQGVAGQQPYPSDDELKQKLETEQHLKGVKVLSADNPNLTDEERALARKFEEDRKAEGVKKPVKLAIYESDLPQANSIRLKDGTEVAVISTKELEQIREQKNAKYPLVDREVALPDHELGHIRNGDNNPNRKPEFVPKNKGDEPTDKQWGNIVAHRREKETRADDRVVHPGAMAEVLTNDREVMVSQSGTPRATWDAAEPFGDHPATQTRAARLNYKQEQMDKQAAKEQKKPKLTGAAP